MKAISLIYDAPKPTVTVIIATPDDRGITSGLPVMFVTAYRQRISLVRKIDPGGLRPMPAKRRSGALFKSALRDTGGQVIDAAGLLGISRTTLRKKMKRLGLDV